MPIADANTKRTQTDADTYQAAKEEDVRANANQLPA